MIKAIVNVIVIVKVMAYILQLQRKMDPAKAFPESFLEVLYLQITVSSFSDREV